MELFHFFSILITVVAIFGYINYRYIGLPSSIGLMLISIVFSLCVIGISHFFPSITAPVKEALTQLDFPHIFLDILLSFMLYAGAIHVRIEDLRQEKVSVILFSTLSVLISTFLVGGSLYFLVQFFGLKISFIQCLLFGSLISPTDPIAVLSILKKAGISRSLETKIAGESLFNDGVAVVVFLTILEAAQGGTDNFQISRAFELFAIEAGGGIVLGFLLGYIAYKLISSIDQYMIEVIITLAIVMGGYTLAHFIHVSGPLAMVIAGIITGNHGKSLGMSDITADYIDKFWELIDEILNAVLFVLIGFEFLIIDFNSTTIIIASISIFLVLIVRFISLLIPSLFIRFKEKISRNTLYILTWGGLRGGISVALALSLTEQMNKNFWVTITYIIACFSIIVQGLSIGQLYNKSENTTQPKMKKSRFRRF